MSMRRGALGLSRMACLAALLSVAAFLPVAPAGAEPSSKHEYHEVTRFGGLDEAAFAGGKPTPGKFVEPTGFAVDATEGEEAIYVADRTSSAEGVEGPQCEKSKRCAEWRLQKLSSTGAVLGTTTFTLPVGAELLSGGRAAPSMIAGLAVDHAAGRLYALVMGPLGFLNAFREHATAAQEVLAWSTTPGPCTGKCETGGALTAATGEGIRSDPLGSTGGLVSSQQQLAPLGKTPLYDPQGLVVDHIPGVGVDPVAIEASNLKGSTPKDENISPLDSDEIEYREFEVNGDTVVQQVATQKGIGPKSESLVTGGLRGEPWSGASVASELGGSRGPLGIFDDPDGHISVLLRGKEESGTNAYLVRLGPDLSKPEVLSSDKQEAQKLEQATMILASGPFFDDPGEGKERENFRNGANEVWGAGPEVTELSSSKPNEPELYAADFFFPEPTCAGTPGYWHTEEKRRTCRASNPPFVQKPGANIGVRLLQPASSGLVSDPQGRTIVNTIGDEHAEGNVRPEAHSPCEIGAQDAALAAGAGGTLWVFDRGPTSGKLAEGAEQGEFVGPRTEAAEGREIIELAPGEGSPKFRCPQPSGTFAMSLCGSGKPAANSLTAPVGAPITFDASSVDLAHGTPFAYRWEFGDGTEGHKETEPHAFSKAGTYTVTLRVRTDFGEYVTSATVQVEPTESAALLNAQFTVTSPNGARETAFDASGSSAGTCNNVYDYRWEWGDGTAPQDFQKPTAEHAYPTLSEPRKYQVTLTVVNSPEYERKSSTQTVEVSPPEASLTEGLPSEAPLLGLGQGAPTTSQGKGAQAPITPARGPTYVSPRASFSRGTLRVRISCPTAKVSCGGQVQVQTAAPFPASVTGSGKAKPRRGTGRLAIGSAPFSLPGGATGTVAVHLAARGASLLARLRRLPVLVTVSAHDPLGDPGVASLRLTLAAPRPAR